MNCYIVTTTPFPFGLADSKRICCYAKALIENGLSCQVIIYKSNNYNKHNNGSYEGIDYLYITGDVNRKENSFSQRVMDIWDRVSLMLYMNKILKKGDIVFSYGIFYTSLMRIIIHKRGCFFIEDICEYPFLSSKESVITRIKRYYYTHHLLPRMDGIVTISKSLEAYISRFISCKQILRIPILVDFNKYCLEDKSSETNVKYIFHAGSMTEQKDGILGMLEAFGIFSQKYKCGVKFICTGNAERSLHYNEIKEIIWKYEISDKVEFLGFIDENTYNRYLQYASVVIINKYNTLQNKYCFSTKLGEYMAAGKGIIITNVGEAVNWVSNDKDVKIIEPQDNNVLSDAIAEMFFNDDYRNKLSKEAKIMCQNKFDYRQYGRVLLKFFNEISDNG